jgi:Tol biopolymer transport system component
VRVTLSLLAVGLLALVSAMAGETSAAPNASGSSIAYLHFQRTASVDSVGVYVMEVDGSNERLVTKGDWFAWSPTGSRLLVHRFDRGRHSIYVVNRDGSGLIRVVSSAENPTWAPDEMHIAFRDIADADDAGIHTVRLDGTKETRLTRPPEFGSDNTPAWSPNGRLIAFERWTGDVFQLAVVAPTGQGLRVLVECINACGAPRWSPSGRRLAFADDGEIWIVNPDGTGLANLTNSPKQLEENPSWSPKGRFLAFESSIRGVSRRRSNPEIHTVRVDGRRHRNITHQPGFDAYPDWSPDGRSIAFSSIRDGNIDVWIITPTGKNARNLTNDDEGWQNLSARSSR